MSYQRNWMTRKHGKNIKVRGYELSSTLFFCLSQFEEVSGTYQRVCVVTATLGNQRDGNFTKGAFRKGCITKDTIYILNEDSYIAIRDIYVVQLCPTIELRQKHPCDMRRTCEHIYCTNEHMVVKRSYIVERYNII